MNVSVGSMGSGRCVFLHGDKLPLFQLVQSTLEKISFYLDSTSSISSLHMPEFFGSELSSALRRFVNFLHITCMLQNTRNDSTVVCSTHSRSEIKCNPCAGFCLRVSNSEERSLLFMQLTSLDSVHQPYA